MTDFTSSDHRAYYLDAGQHQFNAQIIESQPNPDIESVQIVLDKTYFYPDSGGQPCDYGSINGYPVRAVSIRETDGAILHDVEAPVRLEVNTAVECKIDTDRRFDHMQQHTGQHILSRAFIDLFEFDTVGFHLTDERLTIDLQTKSLTYAQLTEAETRANQIIFENRPISIRLVSHAEADRLPLRKRPPVQSALIRLIDINRFDLNACGGTHVSATGAVGLIKITKVEKRKDKTRLTFCCGERALNAFRTHHAVTAELTQMLTTGVEQLPGRVEKMRQESKQLSKQLKLAKKQRIQAVAEAWWAAREIHSDVTLIRQPISEEWLKSAGDCRALIGAVQRQGRCWVICGFAGTPSTIFLVAPSDSNEAFGSIQKVIQESYSDTGTVQIQEKSGIIQLTHSDLPESILTKRLHEWGQMIVNHM